jgi:hypothetical protein
MTWHRLCQSVPQADNRSRNRRSHLHHTSKAGAAFECGHGGPLAGSLVSALGDSQPTPAVAGWVRRRQGSVTSRRSRSSCSTALSARSRGPTANGRGRPTPTWQSRHRPPSRTSHHCRIPVGYDVFRNSIRAHASIRARGEQAPDSTPLTRWLQGGWVAGDLVLSSWVATGDRKP